MAITETKRPPPFFLADDTALDFLNSVATPWGDEIEWIDDGRDLLAWLEHAGLVPAAILMRFRDEALLEEVDKVAMQARELREWFRAFVSAHAGLQLEPSALDELHTLNRLLARDDTFRQIEMSGLTGQHQGANKFALRWRRERRWRAAEDLLLPLAEAMGDLLCGVDFARVKNCEGPTCTLWFDDVSKNHSRRWCSMAVCGNRTKAAAHRAKKRSTRYG